MASPDKGQKADRPSKCVNIDKVSLSYVIYKHLHTSKKLFVALRKKLMSILLAARVLFVAIKFCLLLESHRLHPSLGVGTPG